MLYCKFFLMFIILNVLFFPIKTMQGTSDTFFSYVIKVANYFCLRIGMKFYSGTKYVTLETSSKNSLLDSDLIIGNKFTHLKLRN